MDVKSAIMRGDPAGLERLLAEDPARANQMIEWGEPNRCVTHPLHFVSDMLFNGTLEKGKELALVDALIRAGAEVDYRPERGETALIGAASLGAEDVGLRLLEAGARTDIKGSFGETALHWAAWMGEARLVARLLAGSDLNLKDAKYSSTPLEWALHGQKRGNHGQHEEVVKQLREAMETFRAG